MGVCWRGGNTASVASRRLAIGAGVCISCSSPPFYRIGARLLGNMWHIPSHKGGDRAYIIIESVGMLVTFPIKTLELDVSMRVPSLDEMEADEYARVRRLGTFSGTLDEEDVA